MTAYRGCFLLGLLVAIALAGCSSSQKDGGYYGGDRPPDRVPADLDAIPDAVPRVEPLSKTGNNPYTALGNRYTPMKSGKGYVKQGMASWYGSKFHGRRTSSGEPYDMFAMTAAHPTLPLPSYVRVTNLDNQRSVVVKVNDRGPFLHDRIIDLSYAAAHKLDIARTGTGRVEVRFIDPAATASKATNEPSPVYSGVVDTVVPAAAASETAPAAGVLIQIGAYSELDNAMNMRQLLQLAGYEVVPLFENPDTAQGVYRVRVGPFPDYEVALANKAKLESMLGHPVAVVSP